MATSIAGGHTPQTVPVTASPQTTSVGVASIQEVPCHVAAKEAVSPEHDDPWWHALRLQTPVPLIQLPLEIARMDFAARLGTVQRQVAS